VMIKNRLCCSFRGGAVRHCSHPLFPPRGRAARGGRASGVRGGTGCHVWRWIGMDCPGWRACMGDSLSRLDDLLVLIILVANMFFFFNS